MPTVPIMAVIDRSTGDVQLRFSWDIATNEALKAFPGTHWDPKKKRWMTSEHGLEAIKREIPIRQILEQPAPPAQLPDQLAARLRPYQIDAAQKLIKHRGFMLTMDPRTGKTPTAITALAGMMQSGRADSALIIYPAGVKATWRKQLNDWAYLSLVSLEGTSWFDQQTIAALRARPFLVLGVHNELLKDRERDLHEILTGRKYVLVIDEGHAFANRKAPRTATAKRLSEAVGLGAIMGTKPENMVKVTDGTCVATWLLTGTPMRNRPRDLFTLFDIAKPGSMGGYWTYAKKYCDAHIGDDGFWKDKGESNPEELATRLSAISYRVTRAQVAQYLPKSDRSVIVCNMNKVDEKKYRALEKAFATSIQKGLGDAEPSPTDRNALKQIAAATAKGKIPTAIERAYLHCERGSKVLIFGNFHETLQAMDEALDAHGAELGKKGDVPFPHFCAGGWMLPDKRSKVIAQWAACPGPAILLVNTIASGTGIDLSDAEVAVFLELAWVPADFVQAEARIQDIHLGKRTTPPLYEYLIVKNTVDESMGSAMLQKVRAIESVVGADAEMGGVADALRGAGVVGPSRLGLANTDKDTIQAMISGIRDRLMGDGPALDSAEALAADLQDAFDGEDSDNADAEL